jgi:hypothetical protein
VVAPRRPLCEQGRFGQKDRRGLVPLRAGQARRAADPASTRSSTRTAASAASFTQIADDEIVDRCILALVAEGARVLDDGIAQRASDIDVVYLTGYGFPRHAGGRCSTPTRAACTTSRAACTRSRREARPTARSGRRRRASSDWRAKEGRSTMTAAVIVSTARTPLAKSWRGAFNMTHGATMGGHAVRHALERARLAPAEVDDVVMGCALPEGATGWNIARQIALRAGCPVDVPGMTVNRFCSSGLQSIALAAQRIIAGEADAIVAGGVESISCVQNEMNQHMRREAWLAEHVPAVYWSMLETAETVARRYAISRERQDEYGVRSQVCAAAAQAAGASPPKSCR